MSATPLSMGSGGGDQGSPAPTASGRGEPRGTIYPVTFLAGRRAKEVSEGAASQAARAGLSGRGICLLGQGGCGKTTLLFQYAMNASAQGLRVVLLCGEGRLMRSPPRPELLTEVSEGVLRRIELKYIDSGATILKYLARLHELPVDERPSVILVDDFSSWFYGDKAETVRTLCVLDDTVQWLAAAQAQNDPHTPLVTPHYVVSDVTTADGFSIARWVPLVGRVTAFAAGQRLPSGREVPHTRQGDGADGSASVLYRLTLAHTQCMDAHLYAGGAAVREALRADVWYYFGAERFEFVEFDCEMAE